ncbi:WxcM-like domain-containing protein [Candidatus Beckwithbacteria bacterium]|nr:WxcM-like domain-containing protein [Candidatus Beckwithbacteria bacterium]
MKYKLLKFNIMGDDRGSLISLEQSKNIPFKINRVYYIYGTKTNVVRGKHAHTSLKQVVVCVNGSCKFLLDDGLKKEVIELNSPDVGLYIGKNIWREIYNFSKDCILIVLANKQYNEEEYIRDYKKFIKTIKK